MARKTVITRIALGNISQEVDFRTEVPMPRLPPVAVNVSLFPKLPRRQTDRVT